LIWFMRFAVEGKGGRGVSLVKFMSSSDVMVGLIP